MQAVSDQVVWVHVAVHAHVGTSRSQVAHHSARAWPEVLEGILSVDTALNGMTLGKVNSNHQFCLLCKQLRVSSSSCIQPCLLCNEVEVTTFIALRSVCCALQVQRAIALHIAGTRVLQQLDGSMRSVSP